MFKIKHEPLARRSQFPQIDHELFMNYKNTYATKELLKETWTKQQPNERRLPQPCMAANSYA